MGAILSLAALPRLPGQQGPAVHATLPGTDFRSIRYVFTTAGWKEAFPCLLPSERNIVVLAPRNIDGFRPQQRQGLGNPAAG